MVSLELPVEYAQPPVILKLAMVYRRVYRPSACITGSSSHMHWTTSQCELHPGSIPEVPHGPLGLEDKSRDSLAHS